ncbi:hypothetical protein ILUMI_23125 [Ignelater luminosus]|uniref:GST C-terminal domain-containing protein n=1 Tax=Ignelater luminosus TaxID=2038154 RepID=A0A8K0G276_IGNLU|nr:hypothetical protein ILUMI_23125 [Ignelater luminosus]
MVYLVHKYSPNDDSLYPVDSYKRAEINQIFFFNSRVLFPPFRKAVNGVLKKGKKDICANLLEDMKEGFQFLEEHLADRLWLAGNRETLADHAVIPNVTTMYTVFKIAPTPNISAWIKRAEKLPCYEENIPGLIVSKKLYDRYFC